jgi:hypothetical protein
VGLRFAELVEDPRTGGPIVADVLTDVHGWSPDRYEKWLAHVILASVVR